MGLKTFFGGIFIEKEKLEEVGINYPIKLEYYKRINEDEYIQNKNNNYGIAVVKTEYLPGNTKCEKKEIKYLTNDENKVDKILKIFKENEVTPIGVDDVICDFYKNIF